MKLMIAALVLCAAGSAQASSRCQTSSNGHSFSSSGVEYDARNSAVQDCRNDYSTFASDCERNLRCTDSLSGTYGGNVGGTYGGVPFDSSGQLGLGRGSKKAPTASGTLCFVKQTNQWLSGRDFFSLVYNHARSTHACAVAKIASVPFSTRIYDASGSRVGKDAGGLSDSETERELSAFGLYGCERYTCQETL